MGLFVCTWAGFHYSSEGKLERSSERERERERWNTTYWIQVFWSWGRQLEEGDASLPLTIISLLSSLPKPPNLLIKILSVLCISIYIFFIAHWLVGWIRRIASYQVQGFGPTWGGWVPMSAHGPSLTSLWKVLFIQASPWVWRTEPLFVFYKKIMIIMYLVLYVFISRF